MWAVRHTAVLLGIGIQAWPRATLVLLFGYDVRPLLGGGYGYSTISLTMYTCPNADQKKCTFTELQMRSADEGSTTFVTCVDCSINVI
jgi:hypothetical protein